MIKLTSAEQARALRGKIPELAVLRMEQFEGSDGKYCPDVHGYLVVAEPQDRPSDFKMVGEEGLVGKADGWPLFDFLQKVEDGGTVTWEAVVQCSDEFTVALIVPVHAGMDEQLLALLEAESEGYGDC